jgi:3-oxoadipate enol-lactonase
VSTVKVGSIDMYYEEHGSGEPLLLIMGLATDSTGWLLQVPALSERYRTIVFDNRGVGRTSKPAGPYTIAQMADDTAGLMDAIGLESAHVLGISLGGMIAQELVLRHPRRVRALVLACTYAAPDENIRQNRTSLSDQLGVKADETGKVTVDVSSIDPMMLFQTLLPRVFNPEFLATDLPKLMQIFAGALQYGFSMEAVLAQVEASMGHDTTDRLSTIRSPTLVITGDADRLIPPRSSDVLAAGIPEAKLVKIPGGSHAFNFETPDAFNREVLDFLAGAAVHA